MVQAANIPATGILNYWARQLAAAVWKPKFLKKVNVCGLGESRRGRVSGAELSEQAEEVYFRRILCCQVATKLPSPVLLPPYLLKKSNFSYNLARSSRERSSNNILSVLLKMQSQAPES